MADFVRNVNLDDVQRLREIDRSDMLGVTRDYPTQFERGLVFMAEASQVVPREWRGERFTNVVVFGTGGGSAAGANLLKAYLWDELRVPLMVHQGYSVPGFVSENTLALVVTYSGNTEETLAAFEGARLRGARCAVITTGGRLAELAEAARMPLVRIPGGLAPRAALGYLMLPMMGMLEGAGLIGDKLAEVREAIRQMVRVADECSPEVTTEANPAKSLAAKLFGLTPVVYGSLEDQAAVAWRWKNQSGENSKSLAMWNAVPPLHHDEVVGWDQPVEQSRRFAVVLLRDETEPEKIARRMDITRELLADRAASVNQVWAKGQGRFARMMSLVHLGDFVSIYLALAGGVDPSPVHMIDLLKEKMARG